MSVVTWDNGSLTAECTELNIWPTTTKFLGAKGKYYCELSILDTGFSCIDIRTGFSVNRKRRVGYYGEYDNRKYGVGYVFDNNDNQYINVQPYPKGYITGDIVGICIDIDDSKVLFYVNNELCLSAQFFNVTLANSNILLGSGSSSGVYGLKATANFGATPFKYPIPEGYTSYDGNQNNTTKYLLKDDEGYKAYIPESETCIPNMTSNTTPSGVASCSSYLSGCEAYTAFTNNDKLYWECGQNSVKPWIQYKFETPKKITKYYVEGIDREFNLNPASWILEGSNNGSSYTSLHNVTNSSQSEKLKHYFEIKNTNFFSHYRITCLIGGTFGYVVFKRIKFYEEYIPEHFKLVSTEFPTDQQFKEKGMDEIPYFDEMSGFSELITYTTDNLSKGLVKFKPKEKTVLSSGAINFSGKELKKVSLIGTENAKVLFSKDRGETWYGNVALNKIPVASATSNSTSFTALSSPDKTIDGNNNQESGSHWLVMAEHPGSQNGHRLVLDLSEPTKISKAIITAGTQIKGHTAGVKDFEIFGCNEIGKETLLYSGTAPNTTQKIISTTTFINDDTPYRYLIYNIKNSYISSIYIIVTEVEIFGMSSPTPLSDISTQGITLTQLTAITPDEWKAFMGDASTLRFAYYLPDETANTDKLELTVDFVGE